MELESVSLGAVLCMLVTCAVCKDEAGGCEFIYTQQPPTNLSCSPDLVLELVCEAHSTRFQEQRFGLLWFGVTIDKEPVLLNDLVAGVRVSSTTGDMQQVTSTLSLTLTLQGHVTTQLFCQIELHDGTLLQPSQHLSLHGQHSTLCSPPLLIDTTPTCVGGQPIALDQAGTTPFSVTPTDAAIPVALYSVVGVIVLFIVVIISLSIIVVVLYRKRVGHMEVSSLVDHGSVMDSCDVERSTVKLEEGNATKQQLARHPNVSSTPPPPRPPKPAMSGTTIDMYGTLSEDHNAPELAEPNITSSSNRHKKKLKFKVLDSRHLGGYECSPTYQCSSTVTAADDDKYSGDYERDPSYRRHFPAKQLLNFDPLLPHRIPPPDEVLEGHGIVQGPHAVEAGLGRCDHDSRTDKYRGDYERCQTYVLPPNSAQCGVGSMDGPAHVPARYRGDYERNPVYMERMLQDAAAHQDTARQDTACQDTACQDTTGHGYTTLAATTRQAPQPYATTLTRTHVPPNISDCPLFPYDLPP